MNSNLLIAVVLYECQPHKSKTILTLRSALKEAGAQVRVVVINNSRQVVIVPSWDFEVYQSDSNRGLAEPYDLAATLCLRDGIDYLVTFDQDTAVTLSYIRAMIGKSASPSDKVGAYVPLVRNESNHLSPGYYNIEKGLYHSHKPVLGNDDLNKLKSHDLPYAFNSGTMWNVKALKDCGGFPQRYPLDMLDHAMFRRLYLKGWKVEVVDEQNSLMHGLSIESKEGMSLGRAQNYLDAVHQYYVEEIMLAEYFHKVSPESNLKNLGSNYMGVLLRKGLKRFVMGILGRQLGNPTTQMYFDQLQKLRNPDEMHSFVPFESEILDKVEDYTSIRKIKVF